MENKINGNTLFDFSITENKIKNIYASLQFKLEFDKSSNVSQNFSPFIHLVNYWSQILGNVVGKCTDYNIRKYLVKNLFEENCEELTHVETFYLFLQEIGYIGKINDIKMTNIIDNYKKSIDTFILLNSFDDCCQMLGAIEYVYHIISAGIVNYYESRGQKLNYHFEKHDSLDITHARELYLCNKKEISDTNILFGVRWIVGVIDELINY